MASSDVSHHSQPCIYGDSRQMESPYNQRKSGFMKWFSKLFKGSGRRTTNGRRPEVVGEENMFWHDPRSMDDRSRAENEDLDHAIALSLAEDVKKRNGHRGRGYEDEGFTRAIDESLGGRPSFCPYNPNPIQFLPRGFRLCGGCKQEIGYGHYLSCMGTFWHPHCFRCYSCAQPISETEFSLSGSYPYHKTCYKELHHPKCDICNQFIPTNMAGLIEYRAHPFWGQKYCPSHEHDSTPRCCSCERMESRSARYIALGDGRSLCLECLDSAVMDTGECQPLYHAIRDFYEGMYMKIDQQIPMLLVERQALNEAMEGEKDGPHHIPETRGLCLSEEQTVSSILKKPRIGKNRILDMRTYPQKLARRCEVTAILVLYGLPRLLTGSILAHELMHGWLRLKGYRNLSPEVEEGICQVLSHMWLESEVIPGPSFAPSSSNCASSSSSSSSSYKKGGKSKIEKKLGEFFMNQIAHDISPAYGEGFRMAQAAVNRSRRWTLTYRRMPFGEEIKINIDGSFQDLDSSIGFGGILRDSSGSCKILFLVPIFAKFALHTEFISCLKTLQIIFHHPNKDYWLEFDSLLLINILKSNMPSKVPWYLLPILKQIRSYYSNLKIRTSHVFREANKCADYLTKCGASSCIPMVSNFLNLDLLKLIDADNSDLPYIRA